MIDGLDCAKRLGDENRGNTLLTDGGKLSGSVAEPILGREITEITVTRKLR